MTKYYNPNSHSVSITGSDGGRLTIPPVIPGKQPKLVEGDYYEKLVDMGILAKWNNETARRYKMAYLDIRMAKFRKPAPPKPEPEPEKEVEEEVESNEEGKALDAPMFTEEKLEESTINELKSLIELHGLGELPKETTKKADIIQFILENQE